MAQQQPDAVTLIRKRDGVTDIGVAGLDKGMPVTVRAMSVWKMVLVRVARTYLSTALGLLTVSGTGLIDLSVPGHAWGAISTALIVSAAPAFVSLLHNVLDFLTQLDVTRPEWRA